MRNSSTGPPWGMDLMTVCAMSRHSAMSRYSNIKGRKEMFYLTTHSTHFIYGYMASWHMVKDHSDSEWGNPLPPHGLLFPINSKGFFYMHNPIDRIAHTTAFVTPVVEHWLEREIAQWVHLMKDRSDDPSHHERTLLPQSYISLLKHKSTKQTLVITLAKVCSASILCWMFVLRASPNSSSRV